MKEGVLQGDAQWPELIPTPPTKLSVSGSGSRDPNHGSIGTLGYHGISQGTISRAIFSFIYKDILFLCWVLRQQPGSPERLAPSLARWHSHPRQEKHPFCNSFCFVPGAAQNISAGQKGVLTHLNRCAWTEVGMSRNSLLSKVSISQLIWWVCTKPVTPTWHWRLNLQDLLRIVLASLSVPAGTQLLGTWLGKTF